MCCLCVLSNVLQIAAWSIWGRVGNRGAYCTLLTSSLSALTCACALAIVLFDMAYITDCCAQIQHSCEMSNLCTSIVSNCCYGSDLVSKGSAYLAVCMHTCLMLLCSRYIP